MIKDLIKGLQILAKYNADAEIVPEHDRINIYDIKKEQIFSPQDLEVLESVYCYWDDDLECWYFFT